MPRPDAKGPPGASSGPAARHVVAVLLDSSAALAPFQHSIDLEPELNRILPAHVVYVPSPIREELTVLATKGSGAARRYAKMALRYIERFETLECGGKGDDALLAGAKIAARDHPRVVVVTLDKPLRQRVRAMGHAVAYLQGRRKLELDGWVG